MKTKLLFLILLFASIVMHAQITLTASLGTTSGSYTTLKGAFGAINAGTHKGVVVIKVNASTTEIASAVLNASGTGSASYTTVNIYPTVSGLSIVGNLATPLIDLSGTDNVTIDGRVNATGTTNDLTIENTSISATAGTSTIRFINDASNNTVKYCTIKGSATGTGAVVYFSTGTTTGNDNNVIDHNNITNSGGNMPKAGIYSLGSAAAMNSGCTLSNNKVYNLCDDVISTHGLWLSDNNSAWTISGNSLYETTPLSNASTGNYYAVSVNSPTGVNFTITGNYIGGRTTLCGGSALTRTSASAEFYGISVITASGTASNIQGNTIKNINWTNTGIGAFYGINTSGDGSINIGTVTGNTIGATTGTGSITVTNGTTGAYTYGINAGNTGALAILNNTIGSITAANTDPAASSHICGIYITAASAATVSDNVIGSTSTTNSLYASSPSTGVYQRVRGIYASGASSTITGNTISNLKNGTTNSTAATTGLIEGVYANQGSNVITGNTISNLTIANANNLADYQASVGGIVLENTTAAAQTISGNTISGLSNTNAAFTGSVMGVYYNGSTTPGSVSGNFINGLSVNASSSADIYGIKILAGVTTYSNNVISLGGTTLTDIYGIYENGALGNDNSLYFNTVYIGGAPSGTGASNSFCLYSALNTNTRDFRNNVFYNARSSSGTVTGKHYGAFLNYATPGSLTIDYNDYYVSGTGKVLGNYKTTDYTTLSTWLTATVQDAHSLATNPSLKSAGSAVDTDYETLVPLNGVTGSGVRADYSGVSRALIPTMGAFESANLSTTLNVDASGSLPGSYMTLKTAFDAINAGVYKGKIEVAINTGTTETASAVLNASGTGSSSYTSVNIYPTVSGLSIAGNLATPLIDLSGADNVTIDGRVNATGTTIDMSIVNSSVSATAGTSTIRFINDASNNTVKYCTIKGSGTGTGAVVYFSTGTATGNNGNVIDHNNITSTSATDKPVAGIYSLGLSATIMNSNCTVSNNNIYNLFDDVLTTHGLWLGANNSAWTLTGNSIYETTTLVTASTGNYYAVSVNSPTGNGFTISNNYIGGTAAQCGGSTLTRTNASSNFTGIYLAAATGTANDIQGNAIQNIKWFNTDNGTFYGINTGGAGDINIGTVTGNIIGATTGNGSINVTNGTTGAYTYGINAGSTGALIISNNKIGSITAANTDNTASSNILGINITGTSVATVSANVIGSVGTTNSLNASSASTTSAQMVKGIVASGGTATITGNTISKLTNGTTNSTVGTAGLIDGIFSDKGSNTISGNTISNLTIANTNNLADYQASVGGIVLDNIVAAAQTISGNTISGLSNTNAAFAGSVIGLYYNGSTTPGSVSGNFINGLSVNANSTADIYGIKMLAGVTTYSNNVITLGGNTPTDVYGIYENGATGNNNKLYFNTVYIAGTPATGISTSNCLYSAQNTNTRDFRNNVFYNTRSNSGTATGKHYGAFLNYATPGSLTIDYNDYYVTGTGKVLGNYKTTDYTTLSTWQTATVQDAHSLATNPSFQSAGSLVDTDYKTKVALNGVTGTGISTDYSGTQRALIPMVGAFESANPVTTLNVDASGSLKTLKAAFDAINAGTYTGKIEVAISTGTTETASAVLNASGTGSSSYTSVNIYPLATGLSISGNLATPLIDLSGADNVTIDGRVNATGTAIDMSIVNSSVSATAGTSTIRFINDASNNTVNYCTIKGSGTGTGAVVYFSTGTATGNNSNVIDHNNITSTSATDKPSAGIYSLGSSATKMNSNCTVSNNNIYNLFDDALTTHGLWLGTNNSAWTLTGNSIYETTALVTTSIGNYYAVSVNSPTGNGFMISNNYIGGSAAQCGGSALTRTNTSSNFTGIYLATATGTPSDIQGNTIQNIKWSNTDNGTFYGINTGGAGDINIGTVTGNIIGATTGNGSITVTDWIAGDYTYGINAGSTGVLVISNNKIGSITATNTDNTASSNIIGINITGTSVATVSANIIGSVGTTNSLVASSTSTTSAQMVKGIVASGGTATITGNTISNLTNGTYNSTVGTAGLIDGIFSDKGSNTITGNTISNLTIANANNLADYQASVGGIVLDNIVAAAQTISGNTISGLSNINTAFTGGVIGLYYNGSITPGNVSGNFITGLSVNANSFADIYGIKMLAGVTTYSNNVISLGDNTRATLYGIYENGAAGNNNNLYFNTVYIGGAPTSGTLKSYALYSAQNSTRDFRNNVFSNARSNGVNATGKHYASYFNNATGLTLDYNDYSALGAGGVLGYCSTTDVTALPLVSGTDVNSSIVNPMLRNAGGTSVVDYIATTGLPGVSGTGITTDYNNKTRTTPRMGAICPTVTGDWGTAATWADNVVPTSSNDVMIPTGETITIGSANASCKALTIYPGAKLTLNSGKTLNATTLNINSNAANGTGTFVDMNASGGLTVTGTTNMQVSLGGATGSSKRAWWYLSSPVSNATSQMFYNESGANELWNYEEATNPAPAYKDILLNGVALNAGTGYVAYLGGTDATYTFTGNALNTGTISTFPTRTGTSALKRGFNLMGNPYPSYLDWNSTEKTNVRSSIWVRTFNGTNMLFDTFDGTYGTSNGLNGIQTQYIAPMQAFWVRVNADGDNASLVYKNSMRSHQDQSLSTNRMRVHGATAAQVLRLKVSNGTNSDEAIVVTNPNASDSYDSYDTPKMSNNNAAIPEIYSMAGTEEIVINSLNAITPNMQIALGFKTDQANTFTIRATEISNFDADTKIIIKDNLLNSEQELTADNDYSFTSDVTDNNTRFSILFKSASITTGILSNGTDQENVRVFKNINGLLTVCRSNAVGEGIVTVSNVLGQIVMNGSTTGTSTVFNKSFIPGIYMVSVNVQGVITTKKVRIN